VAWASSPKESEQGAGTLGEDAQATGTYNLCEKPSAEVFRDVCGTGPRVMFPNQTRYPKQAQMTQIQKTEMRRKPASPEEGRLGFGVWGLVGYSGGWHGRCSTCRYIARCCTGIRLPVLAVERWCNGIERSR
jgi:hypothetical protein